MALDARVAAVVTANRSRARRKTVPTRATTIRPTVEVREQMDAVADETGQSLTLVFEAAFRVAARHKRELLTELKGDRQ